MRKLRLQKVKSPVLGHMAGRWQLWYLNPLVNPNAILPSMDNVLVLLSSGVRLIFKKSQSDHAVFLFKTLQWFPILLGTNPNFLTLFKRLFIISPLPTSPASFSILFLLAQNVFQSLKYAKLFCFTGFAQSVPSAYNMYSSPFS